MSNHSQIRYVTELSTLKLRKYLILSWTFGTYKIFELRKYLTFVWTCKNFLDLIILKIQRYNFIVEETNTTMSKHSQIKYVTEHSLLWNLNFFWFSHGLLELRKIFELRIWLLFELVKSFWNLELINFVTPGLISKLLWISNWLENLDNIELSLIWNLEIVLLFPGLTK